MKIDIEPGRYVVAVSGGVDSVVLLHLLLSSFELPDPKYELVVAHFDHGIRPDSEQDRIFVQDLAKKYGLEFEYKREDLGPDTSEEVARDRRYKFLNEIKQKTGAKAIMTAHHADDLLETAVFNMLRGTKRRGLSSLKSAEIIRPLLPYSKNQIIEYAKSNKLAWVEDPTNQQLMYSRNKIRAFLNSLPAQDKQKLNDLVMHSSDRNELIDGILAELFEQGYTDQNHSFDRKFFSSLPHNIATEILVLWLAKIGATYDKKLIEKLTNNLKTLKPGTKVDINKDYYFELSLDQIGLKRRTSV